MSNKFWISVISIIILICIVATLLTGSKSGSIARIYSNGELIDTVDLSTIREARLYTIKDSKTGAYNTIEIEHGRIRVIEASCNDGTCMRMGWALNGVSPIVCLPNKLVILIDDDLNIDGVAG